VVHEMYSGTGVVQGYAGIGIVQVCTGTGVVQGYRSGIGVQ